MGESTAKPDDTSKWDEFYTKAIEDFVKKHVIIRQGAFTTSQVLGSAFYTFCDSQENPVRVPNNFPLYKVIRDISSAAIMACLYDFTVMLDTFGEFHCIVNLELESYPFMDGVGSNVKAIGSLCTNKTHEFISKDLIITRNKT